MPEPAPPRTQLPRFVRMLLRIPLFYKILIANAVLVAVGTVFGIMVATRYVRYHPESSTLEIAGLLSVTGVLASVGLNALILRLALQPLRALERTAARVRRGETGARVPLSPVADRELDRLTRTFNAMLDAGEEYGDRLREVASQALNAAEEERKRISRELHDETAQLLAALLIRIRVVKGASDPQALAALLEDMRREIGEALEGIRRFARGLRPPALDELGLAPAIESHLRTLREIGLIDLRLEGEADATAGLPVETELAVYRIVQEALSNVLRHSGATHATVRMARQPSWLRVEVRDDGRGFSVPDVTAAGRGLGLFGMRERAAYLGGRVEVESAPGSGTLVRAEIPVLRESLRDDED